MILKKIEKQTDNGLKTEWMLTEDQASFLLNFAIATLLKEGLVQVLTESMEDSRNQELEQADFLTQVDPELLHKA